MALTQISYTLIDYTKAPAKTFWLPEDSVRKNLKPGMLAKLCFEFDQTDIGINHERMWVKVTHEGPDSGAYVGRLQNEPFVPDSDDLHYGTEITFSWFHVIDVDSGERLIGVWVVPLENADYMGALYESEIGAKFQYRFRYHKDDVAINSTDEKHWYQVDFPPEAEAIEACRKVAQIVAQTENSAVDELLLKNDDYEAFEKELLSRPWAHVEVPA